MKPGFLRILSVLFTLTIFLSARQGRGAPSGFPTQGDDNTQSLGQYTIIVNPSFQAMMAGYPGYNTSTKTLLSPVLFDANTIIGRSSPLLVGSAADINGVPCGSANIIVGQSNLLVQPGGLEPIGTREVHTVIFSLNMAGGGAAVRAGTNAPDQPTSGGEVESWSGASGLPANDFPAQSFFDIFADVDIPAGGSFPGVTGLYNSAPLMVQNTNVTSFPPTVVYVHGMSTAVPIMFRSNNPPYWTAGETFGVLTLAGHGVFQTNSSTGTSTTTAQATSNLQSTLAATTPAPVEPAYSNWAPGLTVASSNMIFPGKGDDTTPSLGTFVLAVNPAFQSLMTGYPGWNTNTLRLTSPLLSDSSTVIGRSAPLLVGSSNDTSGVPVGTVNTIVSNGSLSLIPPLFPSPPGTYEVKTQLRTLDMAGGGAAVRAGTSAPGVSNSFGQVNSLSGPSGDPYWDFPAKSFFDIFVDVDIPAGGSLPAITVSNGTPLIVQQNDLTSFPPKVIYVHGNSSAVPVYFASNYPAIGAAEGDTFGILLIAGHGVGYNSTNPADVAAFQQAMGQVPEQPVAPQYTNWAPNLKTASNNNCVITLICPQNIVVTSSVPTNVFFLPTASDSCGSTLIVTSSPPSGATFNLGTTTVTCFAGDSNGMETCSFTVTVTNAPANTNCVLSITCPPNITVTNNGPTNVFFTVTASDSCGGVPTVNSSPASGSSFPVGTTTVTSTAMDANGTTNCSFTVTVVKPNCVLSITCPPNITVTNNGPTNVFFTVTASDSCGGVPTVNSSPASGSSFPVGTTTVTSTAMDADGTTNCSFTVTVVKPNCVLSIFCPPNITVTNNGATNVFFTVTASDSCGGVPTVNSSPPSGSSFPVGTTTVTSIAMDANGTTNCSFTVTVVKPNCVLSIFCPPNITVTNNGPTNVFFAVTASDSCGGVPTVNSSPASGSSFPIGTTTVTSTAMDANGSTNCSFTVTVMAPINTVVMPPEYFSLTNLLPASNAVYITPRLYHLLYNNGIVISDVRHRFFLGSQPPPPLGSSNVENFSSTVDFQLSQNGGATFTPVTGATANVQITVAHTSDTTSNSVYQTQMTRLDISGGSLPGNIRLQIDPNLPSTGQTTIRPVNGGYMISSFFDVFADISLDGGNTWTPPVASGHVEQRTDPTQVAPATPEPTPLLPAPNDGYVSVAQWHALFANGIVITNVSHRFFTSYQVPPANGSTNPVLETFNSQLYAQVSLNGGSTFTTVGAGAPVTVQLTSDTATASSLSSLYDTQMQSLSATLMVNGTPVMIRTSQTQPSLGATEVDTQPDGTYHINSFFDIFTEISLDGGNTWSPQTNPPVRMELTQIAPEVTNTSPNLPPVGGQYVSPRQWHALYANGVVLTNVSHLRFTGNFGTPGTAGTSTSESFGSEVDMQVSFDGGNTWTNLYASANVGVVVTNHTSYNGTTYFDTQMTQLDLTGGTLPPGMEVRVSPTLPSIGRTSVRTNGGGYMISSFFDVFTEISLDGGNTWSPTITQPGTMTHQPQLTNSPTPIDLACPSNITVGATGPSGAVVFFNVTAGGGCTVPSVVAIPASGSTFPVGMTTVMVSASDMCGDSANCSFTVTVTNASSTNCQINIMCPSNITTAATSSSGATVFFTVNASDSCGGIPNVTSIPASGSTFPLGTTTVTSTASDANGSTNCSFTVTVTNTPISINCSSNISVAATSSSGAVVYFNVNASGGCSPPPFVTANPPSGSTFPIGSTTVLSSASDSCGNSTNCSFTVTVTNTPIFIVCPSNIVVTSTVPTAVYFNVNASGGCSPPPFITANPASGSTFPIGATTVFSTASDTCGNSANCSFTVTVVKPNCVLSIFCPPNITVTNNGATNVFFAVTASDSCGGVPTVNSSPPSGSSFPVGTTTVTSTASDANGSTNCSFTVTVNAPTNNCIISITCPSNIVVTSVGPTNVFFSVNASDSCGGIPTVSSVPPSGSTFPIGATTVTSTASDSNGTNTCSFTVTVKSRQRVFPSGNLVPPTNSIYISPAVWHAQYANGIYISNVVHRAFTKNYPPPGTGQTTNESFGSQVNFMYSSDGGQHWSSYTGNAQCTVKVTSMGASGSNQVYQTQMQELNLNGGTMPTNMQLRISPNTNTPSMGQTVITPSGGDYLISSFFDIFVDLSLDGGQTWMPTSSPGDMELHIDPANPPTILVQPAYHGTTASFTIPTMVGLRYTVQYTMSVSNPSWTVLQVISGNGGSVVVTDSNGGVPKRFYRVLVDEDPNQ
jgi:hypothetical protein